MHFYTDESIKLGAINKCLKKFEEINCEVHTLSIYQNNNKVFSYSPAPYSLKDTPEVYSMSKTFTATVAGIAWDMGLFSLDDKIVDIFPDECPDVISENLASMTVKNVISMNTGHECCVMPHMRHAENSVKAFLAQDVPYMPGTHFAYNTGATCIISSIVEKLTGKCFFDFACEKLFYPMGIIDVYWNKVDDGKCEGGIGLHISNDDISKLGLMYLNGGEFNGKRIVSKDWIDIATSAISDNSGNGDTNWCVGYGCQIWKNKIDGYRADGAFGQFCLVLPAYKAVVTATVLSADTATELHTLIEMAQNLHSDSDEEFTGCDHTPAKGDDACDSISGTYILDKNICGFNTANISFEKGIMNLTFSDSRSQQKISAGNGQWVYSSYRAKQKAPKLLGLMSDLFEEDIKIASSYKAEKDKITLISRHLNNPHTETTVIQLTEGKLHFDINMSPANDGIISLTKLTGKKAE